jgi:hypothetical protein
MESKDPNIANTYGFQTAPPAYDQHQNFPQAPPDIPAYTQQPQYVQGSQPMYIPQGSQVVTGK